MAVGGGMVLNARRRRRRGESENPLWAKTDGAGATVPPQPGGAAHGHLRDDGNGRYRWRTS